MNRQNLFTQFNRSKPGVNNINYCLITVFTESTHAGSTAAESATVSRDDMPRPSNISFDIAKDTAAAAISSNT